MPQTNLSKVVENFLGRLFPRLRREWLSRPLVGDECRQNFDEFDLKLSWTSIHGRLPQRVGNKLCWLAPKVVFDKGNWKTVPVPFQIQHIHLLSRVLRGKVFLMWKLWWKLNKYLDLRRNMKKVNIWIMSLFSEWNLVSPVRACCPQVCDNSKGKKNNRGEKRQKFNDHSEGCCLRRHRWQHHPALPGKLNHSDQRKQNDNDKDLRTEEVEKCYISLYIGDDIALLCQVGSLSHIHLRYA